MPKTPEQVVQEQLEMYNAHDLNAFALTYTEDVVLADFVTGIRWAEGQSALRAYYARVFSQQPHLHGTALHRLMLNTVAIELEATTIAPGKIIHSIIILEVRGERVWRMRTIDPEEMQPAVPSDAIIDSYLVARSTHDLARLVDLHADEIQWMDGISGEVLVRGKTALHEYVRRLPQTIQVQDRIVLGNYVLECEHSPVSDASEAPQIVIYQIKNRLIQRIWTLKPV